MWVTTEAGLRTIPGSHSGKRRNSNRNLMSRPGYPFHILPQEWQQSSTDRRKLIRISGLPVLMRITFPYPDMILIKAEISAVRRYRCTGDQSFFCLLYTSDAA